MICYLGLGANLGDRARAIRLALAQLAAASGVRLARVSPLYETPPWGKTDQPPFLNAAARLHTDLGPLPLLRLCQHIERGLGRTRREKWGPRVIDLDLLHIPGVTWQDEDLTLPHPFLTGRAFALAPLADIAGDEIIGGRTVADWLAGADKTGIRRLPEEAMAVEEFTRKRR